MALADALVALGGSFLAAGLLARIGTRIGLPTIPLFMLAGIALGPHTPGIDLFSDPADLELLAALGLVFLLSYLGLEFSVDDLQAGGGRLALAGGAYLLLIVCFIGLAVLTAGAAEELGVSDAIGAFMIGLILGGTPAAERIKTLVHPLRDAFGALFFFAFGLSISPGAVAAVAGPVAVAAALTLVLNIAAGMLAARLYSFDRVAAANIGLTVLARGEFALVLAALAAAAGLDPRIGAFVAGYVLILAVIGPLLASRAPALAGLIPPRVVRTEEVPA